MEQFVCPRCGNKSPSSIGYKDGKAYCRLCLSFDGKCAERNHEIKEGIQLKLSYPLSEKQAECSKKVCLLLKKKKNVLIHAVTGAGKTELVYHAMENCLKERRRVGFATPRKDVVIDLLPRIQEAFPTAKTIAVFGGHTNILEGDIILLTTHQLYRYEEYFDLLILDEIDAFPYKGNELLHSFFKKSVRGNYILLSATPDKEEIEEVIKDNGEVVTLFERYHHHPLPEPKYIKTNAFTRSFTCLRLLSSLLKQNKPVFIFSPTIEEGRRLFIFLSLNFDGGAFVSSKEKDRSIDIQRFKIGQLRYLVTTSILERGVTVKDLQVIVYDASNEIFTSAALVQIAGRAGRKIGFEKGAVYFLGEEENASIKQAIREIKYYNSNALL